MKSFGCTRACVILTFDQRATGTRFTRKRTTVGRPSENAIIINILSNVKNKTSVHDIRSLTSIGINCKNKKHVYLKNDPVHRYDPLQNTPLELVLQQSSCLLYSFILIRYLMTMKMYN